MTKRRTRRQINIEKVAGVLTLDQLTRFIINCDNYLGDPLGERDDGGEISIIKSCFYWDDTPEGDDYWREIYKSIKSEDE